MRALIVRMVAELLVVAVAAVIWRAMTRTPPPRRPPTLLADRPEPDNRVDLASDHSFPASDPPATY